MKQADRLLAACACGDLEEVRRCLDAGCLLETKNDRGWTPLIVAVFHHHYELVEELLNRGADINACNNKGTTVFMYAKTQVFQNRNFEFLARLVRGGADLSRRDVLGRTVFDYVSDRADKELLHFLHTLSEPASSHPCCSKS